MPSGCRVVGWSRCRSRKEYADFRASSRTMPDRSHSFIYISRYGSFRANQLVAARKTGGRRGAEFRQMAGKPKAARTSGVPGKSMGKIDSFKSPFYQQSF